MDYIFNDWKALLDNFQQSVEKDLEEIHQQKAEVQQIKTDIFNKIESLHRRLSSAMWTRAVHFRAVVWER